MPLRHLIHARGILQIYEVGICVCMQSGKVLCQVLVWLLPASCKVKAAIPVGYASHLCGLCQPCLWVMPAMSVGYASHQQSHRGALKLAWAMSLVLVVGLSLSRVAYNMLAEKMRTKVCMRVSAMQVCRQLAQQGAQSLYEGYRVYANTTPLTWMQAVDANAVRQVYAVCPLQVSPPP